MLLHCEKVKIFVWVKYFLLVLWQKIIVVFIWIDGRVCVLELLFCWQVEEEAHTCGMVFELSPFHTIPLSSLLCLDVVCWVIEKSLPNHICLLEEIDHLYIMDRDHINSNNIITIFLFWYPFSYGLGPLILISTFWFWELGG